MFKRSHRLALAATAALLACGAAPAANIVLNGGFENNPIVRGESGGRPYYCYRNDVHPAFTVDHWTSNGNLGDLGSSCYYRGGAEGVVPAAYEGGYVMNINSSEEDNLVISQDVFLVAGTAYTLSFAVAGFASHPSVGRLSVSLGSDFDDLIVSRPTSLGWLTYSYEYIAGIDGWHTLAFAATDGRLGSVAIDDVSLVARTGTAPLPAPGSLALAATLLAGLGLTRRGRPRGPQPLRALPGQRGTAKPR